MHQTSPTLGDPSSRPAHAARPEPSFDLPRGLRRLARAALIGQLIAMGVLGTLHAIISWAPHGRYHPLLISLFDVDYEMNLPTWFAAMQWMMLAATLGMIAVVERHAVHGRRRAGVWALSAAGAVYLSIDEVAVLHERIGTILEEFLESAAGGSGLRSVLEFQSYYWIVAYLPIVIPVMVALVIFLWKQLGEARGVVFLAMFVFCYAAIGLDFIEGRFGSETHGNLVLRIASRPLPFDVFLLEEMLEMFAVSLLLHGFLRHLTAVVERALGVATASAGHAVRQEGLALTPAGEREHELATS